MMNRINRRLVNASIAFTACLVSIVPAFAQQGGAGGKKRPRTDSRTPFVHRIPLRDEGDVVITFPKPGAAAEADKGPRIKAASIVTTCGKCHDYPAINVGWHFNAGDPNVPAGRNGEPWILTDEGVLDPKFDQPNTRTVLPLSYRKWPGTWRPQEVGYTDWKFAYSFGRHHPGGGVRGGRATGEQARDQGERREADSAVGAVRHGRADCGGKRRARQA